MRSRRVVCATEVPHIAAVADLHARLTPLQRGQRAGDAEKVPLAIDGGEADAGCVQRVSRWRGGGRLVSGEDQSISLGFGASVWVAGGEDIGERGSFVEVDVRVAGGHGAGGGINEGADGGGSERGGEEIARAGYGYVFEGRGGSSGGGGTGGVDDNGGADFSDEGVQGGRRGDVPDMVGYGGKDVDGGVTAQDGDGGEVG